MNLPEIKGPQVGPTLCVDGVCVGEFGLRELFKDKARLDWLETADADVYTKQRWDSRHAAVLLGGHTYMSKEAGTVREALDMARR